MWECRCDCGTMKSVQASHLRGEKIRSCGCLGGTLKHGEAAVGKRTPEYMAWINMKRRCYNPMNDHYEWYGARGVAVCDRWLNDYPAFLADMGRRPSPAHSLERKDVYGNYEPTNCCWLLLALQQRNTRKTKLDESALPMIHGWLQKGVAQQQIADLLHVAQTTISQIKRGNTWKRESRTP